MKKLTLTNLCMNLMQSYGDFRLIANIIALISPTYSDNSPIRRQTAQTASNCVA